MSISRLTLVGRLIDDITSWWFTCQVVIWSLNHDVVGYNYEISNNRKNTLDEISHISRIRRYHIFGINRQANDASHWPITKRYKCWLRDLHQNIIRPLQSSRVQSTCRVQLGRIVCELVVTPFLRLKRDTINMMMIFVFWIYKNCFRTN